MDYKALKPNQLLEIKNPKSYSDDLNYVIEVISYDKNNDYLYGSFNYPVLRYPGDIDTFENYVICCTRKKAIDHLVNAIKTIVRKIEVTPLFYYSESKIGQDLRYDINLDFLIDRKLHIDGFKNLGETMKEYKSKGLLNNEEIKELSDNVFSIIETKENEEYQRQYHYDTIFNIFRKRFILRWSKEEILANKKKLPGDKEITLYEAIDTGKSVIKIDVFAPTDGKYIEYINFMLLKQKTKDGKYVKISDFGTIDTLLIDANKMIDTKYYYKPMKAAKRLYSASRFFKDYKMMRQLLPLLNSEAALLYQIKSEFETLILMFEKIKKLPKKTKDIILSQLNTTKSRLAYISTINFDQDDVYDMIDLIIKDIDKLSHEDIVLLLGQISKKFLKLSNNYAYKYLEDNKIIPLNKKYYIAPKERLILR